MVKGKLNCGWQTVALIKRFLQLFSCISAFTDQARIVQFH